ALVTVRRFAIDATIAVKMSGGTTALSSVTNDEPTVSSVVVRPLGTSPAASCGPMARARAPRPTPTARPSRIWTLNEGNRRFFVAGAAAGAWLTCCEPAFEEAGEGVEDTGDLSGVAGARAPALGRGARDVVAGRRQQRGPGRASRRT